MMSSPYAIPGVSDGGAHTKFFTGGAYSTDFLTWLVRDEGVITLEEAHYRLSNLAAQAAGFQDRGVLREGAAADVLVYDLDELAIDPPWIGDVEYDLPGGEWRRVQRAKGYEQIIVNGEVTFEDGECTRRHARPPAAPRPRLTPDPIRVFRSIGVFRAGKPRTKHSDGRVRPVRRPAWCSRSPARRRRS